MEYSNTGCWELLGNLGFSPQKPEKRALQRDEQAISTWKRKGWPALKKKSKREGRTIVFIDESGLSEKYPVTRTWGLRGHTPVMQQSFTWKQMSAIAALSWWRFYFRFFRGSVKSEQIIEFLGALRRTMGRKLLVIWDGVGCHKSRQVRQWLEAQNGQIAIAFLPPYAPELNQESNELRTARTRPLRGVLQQLFVRASLDSVPDKGRSQWLRFVQYLCHFGHRLPARIGFGQQEMQGGSGDQVSPGVEAVIPGQIAAERQGLPVVAARQGKAHFCEPVPVARPMGTCADLEQRAGKRRLACPFERGGAIAGGSSSFE
ncbi:MAG: IS630 family transposase [Betaproteobacteria bacterium]